MKKDKEKRQVIATLFQVADYAHIAHHIDGRIRIKVSRDAKQGLADVELEPLTQQLPGLKHHRLNNKTGSIVIEYDHTIIPATLWEKIIISPVEDRPELTEELLTIWKQHS